LGISSDGQPPTGIFTGRGKIRKVLGMSKIQKSFLASRLPVVFSGVLATAGGRVR
jgi:hypothetical protein